MKTALIVITLCIIGTIPGWGQSRKMQEPGTPMRVGSIFLNAGAGAGANYRGYDYHSPFGLKASVEFGLWHAGPGVITLGPELGATISSYRFYNGYDNYHSHTVIMAARSAWHFGWKVRGLDTYAGLSAGVGIHHFDYYNTDNRHESYNESFPAIGAFAGASYFVSPHFGFNAEAGFDINNFQLGIVFKLK